jgi:GNAT superfamily N-acetyltransferase
MGDNQRNIKFRTVKPDELSALLDLYQHLHKTDLPLPDENTIQKVWDEIINDPKITLYVADLENKLVSSCILSIIPNLTRGASPYGVIENVVVHEDYRQRGIGKKLLKHALQTAWDNNCYKVMLLTGSKQEKVFRFYERAGFVRGVKTGFIAYPENAS